MSTTPPRSSKRASLIAVVLLAMLIPLGYSALAPAFSRGGEAGDVFLERPDPVYQNCVRETSYMRFHHWELLRQIREDVVRYGIRGDVGLHRCGECHTSRARFCNRCHDATSLYPDCFDCHYYP